MTPQEQELVKKLDQEVKNLSILMQGTEVGDSLTLKEIRYLLYELNKKAENPYEATLPEVPDYPKVRFNTNTTQPPY